MTKQQQIDTLQKQLDAANEQLASVDNALKEQYLNIATGTVDHIESWFQDQRDRGIALSIALNYDDICKFLDNYRNVIESTAPNYTPSVLCQLSMALSETRRQLAEQRIQHEVDKRILKDRLNSIYGVKYCGGKLPKTPAMQYGDEVVDYVLKQQQEDYDKKVKIEVLNKVKSLAVYDDNYLDGYVFVDDIDKLLEELQNDTK